jgi:hypothetical protein
MNNKRAKCVRKAINKFFTVNQDKFPVGEQMKGSTVFNVRRIIYQRMKRLVDTERLTNAEIERFIHV